MTKIQKEAITILQSMMNAYKSEEAMYGAEDKEVRERLDEMIYAKEFATRLLNIPINLGINGKVTVGR